GAAGPAWWRRPRSPVWRTWSRCARCSASSRGAGGWRRSSSGSAWCEARARPSAPDDADLPGAPVREHGDGLYREGADLEEVLAEREDPLPERVLDWIHLFRVRHREDAAGRGVGRVGEPDAAHLQRG